MMKPNTIQRESFLTDSINLSIENGKLFPYFSKIDQQYQVNISDFLKGNIQNKTEFEVHLKYIRRENNHSIFKYQKKSVFVNNEISDLKVYELASECSSCLYPTEFEINNSGKIENITNYREILNKWKLIKNNLLKKYDDENSLRYIDEVNSVVNFREKLIKYFAQDTFLQFYFAPYFKNFVEGKAENEGYFSPNSILYKNKYLITSDEEIRISQTSQSIDKRSIPENDDEIDPDELLNSTIDASFYFHKQNKTLEKANIVIESYLYGKKETTQVDIETK